MARINTLQHKVGGNQRIKSEQFHDKLKQKMDDYAHLIYQLAKKFPDNEKFGITSQLRRAALSVILNYIEGYARRRPNSPTTCNFWEISYASLKESKYLVYFSQREKYLTKDEYEKLVELADEIGAMLWKSLEGIRKIIK